MKKIPGTKLAVMDGEIYSLSHHHIRKPGKHEEPHRVVYQKCKNEEKTIIKTINQ